ncbi:hypothetical protein SDJN02_03329, partial [Cucurbita argyrosperma subsp. argyrosperma]
MTTFHHLACAFLSEITQGILSFGVLWRTRSLEKLMRDLLWEGLEEDKGVHLLIWEVVRKPMHQEELELSGYGVSPFESTSRWFRHLFDRKTMEVMAFLSLTGEFELRSEEDFICGALTLLNAFLIIIVPFSI